MKNGFQGLEGQVLPDLPDTFRSEVSRRYIELYEQITGEEFVPDLSEHPNERMELALRTSLSL
jgi:phosphoribosylaminoimidazole-succinocarboxamide synthase